MSALLPIIALLDTNIWLSCVTHELVMGPKTLPWGNHPVSADMATPVPRALRNKSQEQSNAVLRGPEDGC